MAGAYKEGQTATNPQTGERIVFRGGAWAPATAPITGIQTRGPDPRLGQQLEGGDLDNEIKRAQLARLTAKDGKGKPVPAWIEKPLTSQVGIYGALAGAANTFQDDFAGNTITGGLENTVQGLTGLGTEGQRDWWAQFRQNDNVIRNELFGATLTPSEQAAYAATSINERMAPAEIRRNLASRQKIVAAGLARKVKFARAGGYNGEQIEALLGEFAPELDPALKSAVDGGDGGQAIPAGASTAAPAPPIDPNGEGDIGFGSQASMEANSLPPGAQEFAREAEALIRNGSIADENQFADFAAGKGFQIGDREGTKAAFDSIKAGAPFGGVNTPKFDVQPITERGKSAVGDTIKAFARGVPATIGIDDELLALSDTVLEGGDLRANLARNRAIRDYDEENNFWPRLAGSLTTGASLPSGAINAAKAAAVGAIRQGLGREAAYIAARKAAAVQLGKEGAYVGGAYGVGSSDGDMGDRLISGVVNAAIGFGGGALLGDVGSRIANRGGNAQATGAAQEFGEAAADLGIDYLAADVPGNRPAAVVARMASGVSRMTLGGIPLAEAAEKTIASAKTARDNIADGLGAVGDQTRAGQAAQKGANAWMQTSEARATRLYNAVPVPPERQAVLANTRQALAELNEGLVSNQELSAAWAANPKLQQSMEALKTNGLSWRDLTAFRTIIGKKVGQPSLSSDGADIDALRRLYAGLSEDMRATAAAQGPAALRAFERANQYWQGRQARINDTISLVLGKDLKMSGDKALQNIEALAQKRGGDPIKLSRLMRSMPEDEAGTVRATILDRLGMSSPGRQDAGQLVWSPAEFMTQWSKMSTRAKNVLFQGDHRDAIDKLVRVASGMKGSSEFANTSRTALGANALGLVAAAFANPLLAFGIGGTQFALGKLMASPRMAQWLASAGKKPNPASQLAHVNKLTAVARAEPVIANDIFALQETLARAFAQSPTRAAASPPGQNEKERGQIPPQQQRIGQQAD